VGFDNRRMYTPDNSSLRSRSAKFARLLIWVELKLSNRASNRGVCLLGLSAERTKPSFLASGKPCEHAPIASNRNEIWAFKEEEH
jgi:hypothetical protein